MEIYYCTKIEWHEYAIALQRDSTFLVQFNNIVIYIETEAFI